MSSKQLKNRAYKKKLVHATLKHEGIVVPQFSSLDSADGMHLSAYHVTSVMRSAIRQWEAEHGTVYGAYPVWRRADVVRLAMGTLILDLSSLEPGPEISTDTGKPAQGIDAASTTTESSASSGPTEVSPPNAAHKPADMQAVEKLAADTPALLINGEARRETMLQVRQLLQDDAAGGFEYHEDVEERIQAAPDPALARALVYGVKKGNVTRDPEGDIEWGDVQPIKRKLPLRDDLIIDAQLKGFRLGNSRKLSLSVIKNHSPQFAEAVAAGTTREGLLSAAYDSSHLETRIMQITAAGFPIQYRATVSRGLGGDEDLDFLVHEADPIVDGQAVRGLSDAALLADLLLDIFKRKAGLV